MSGVLRASTLRIARNIAGPTATRRDRVAFRSPATTRRASSTRASAWAEAGGTAKLNAFHVAPERKTGQFGRGRGATRRAAPPDRSTARRRGAVYTARPDVHHRQPHHSAARRPGRGPAPDVDDDAFAASVAELHRLGRTLGVDVVATVTQRRQSLHPAAVLGSGKLEELVTLAGEGRSAPIEAVLVDHDITPVAGAQPGEGDRRRGAGPHGGDPGDLPPPRPLARGQGPGRDRAPAVPGAAPARAGPGKGKDRQRGGIGGKGAGESSLELDRRKIRDRIAELTRELDGAGRGAAHPARAPPRHEPRRAGRLHQRRQVDADARADGQRGLRRRQAVRDAGHDGAAAGARDAPARAGLGHGRLHRQAAARPGGVVQEHARRGAGGGPAGPGRRRVGRRPSSASSQVTTEVLAEIGAGDVPRLLVFNKIDRVRRRRRRGARDARRCWSAGPRRS